MRLVLVLNMLSSLNKDIIIIIIITKIASVLPLPRTNPNCDSSMVTTCLMTLSAIHLMTFIACFFSFSPLYLPRSRASPFPL